MDKTLALKTILLISIIGILFSGYLTYNELVNQVCVLGGSCPFIFNMPACVYGLAMYLLVFTISLIGILDKTKTWESN